jgi:eukaryotic-like serine/threonine-protein kinase
VPAHPEQQFRWTFDLAATPEALWPLVSNTDRFNRDCGYPPVTRVPPEAVERGRRTPPNPPAPERRGSATPPYKDEPEGDPPIAATQRLRASVMGLTIEWDERAFEWLAPQHFAVERTYYSGPVARMVVRCELQPRAPGGTTLIYEARLTPSSVLAWRSLSPSAGGRAR